LSGAASLEFDEGTGAASPLYLCVGTPFVFATSVGAASLALLVKGIVFQCVSSVTFSLNKPLRFQPVVWTDLKGFGPPSLSLRLSSLRPLARVTLWGAFVEAS
jgi:hypothetical protein